MFFDIFTPEVDSSIQYAQWQMEEMNGVKQFTEELAGTVGSALTHSPRSSTMIQKCIEAFVLREVTFCQVRAEKNMNATREAVGHYVEGDQTMSDNSSGALGSLPLLDMPGANSAGPSTEFKINSDGFAPPNLSTDPLAEMSNSINSSSAADGQAPVCTPEDAGDPFGFKNSYSNLYSQNQTGE